MGSQFFELYFSNINMEPFSNKAQILLYHYILKKKYVMKG